MNLAMRNLYIVLFISILAAISGCSSLSEITKLEGEGKKNIYQKNIDVIWPIVILSINDLGIPIIETNKESGYVLAKRGVSVGSYGENIAIFVKKQNDSVTSVEIISKRRLATTVFATDWTDSFFMMLENRLKIQPNKN
ncbi:MAG: hypothetical protein EBZ95_13435 [Chitinophagia bacterium]|nr:hypothetical protein [Chitinophagia bacterium]